MSTPGQRQSPFTVVLRGYDRDQVTDHIRRLEADVAMMAADRDSAHAHADEMYSHLEEARARIAALEHEVEALAAPPTTVAGMGERLTRMLQLATDEAQEIRANARAEADELVSVARQEAEALTAAATEQATRTTTLAQDHADELTTAAEQRDAESREQAAQLLAGAESDAAELRTAAENHAAKLRTAAEDDAAQLRGSSHHIAVARLARSRELAQAASEAHRQVLEHLGALREHLTALPGALELSGDEQELVATTAADDLALLNRPLTGRDRFDLADVRGGSLAAAEQAGAVGTTDVLDAVDGEYPAADEYREAPEASAEFDAETSGEFPLPAADRDSRPAQAS